MKTSSLIGRLLYGLPLLGALLLVPNAPDRGLSLITPFIALSVYARMAAVAAGFRGREEALLFVEALPFFAYSAAFLGGLGPAATLLASLEVAGLWAALLWLESLLSKGGGGFAVALLFMAAAGVSGFALARLPPPAVLGLVGLALTFCAYASARRARA